ncbi:hypothetical protein M426DRAFT_93679 [Hypoxylon sp. CI-4A]|nr:hypothetical protein M426DRAFT_93679 [Hypoxylon sp. CI-4A]
MSDDTPLLGQDGETTRYNKRYQDRVADALKPAYRRAQKTTSRLMNSRAKHWVILVLVILDVAGILSDIFIALITCEIGVEDDAWVRPTRNALTVFSLSLSCVFIVELLLSLFADGWRYFKSWFHRFDAFVIVVGFAIDLLEHNTAEEIASLVVILRLWRFVEIVDEFSVEAEEQSEDLRQRIEDLEKRNAELETRSAALEAQLSRR